MTPSSAPWCSSPDNRRSRNDCSRAVARPKSPSTSSLRAATDPFPDTEPMAVNAASTPVSVSDGSAAGGAVPQRGPADPDLALRQLPGQIRDRDRDLGRARLVQRPGEDPTLASRDDVPPPPPRRRPSRSAAPWHSPPSPRRRTSGHSPACCPEWSPMTAGRATAGIFAGFFARTAGIGRGLPARPREPPS